MLKSYWLSGEIGEGERKRTKTKTKKKRKRKRERRKMEEEIEELGLPKSITSAGEESSSKPSPPTDAVEYDGEKAEEEAEDEEMLGPSPSDAVQRPSSTDAVEGSAPTDDEEKDGEKELSSQEEGKMAVVDVAAVENISSAAE